VKGYIPSVMLGSLVAVRTIKWRTVAHDKRKFLFSNLWLVSIYLLPVIRALDVFMRSSRWAGIDGCYTV
jgi:hypothetical protein